MEAARGRVRAAKEGEWGPANGTRKLVGGMPIEAAVATYLNWKSAYAERAGVAYRERLEPFMKMFVGRVIESISIEDVTRYQFSLKRYASSTVAYDIVVMKQLFEFMRRQGRQVIDPYFIKVPKHFSKPHPAVTVDEFLAMDALLGETPFRELQHKVILNLLYYTGCRVSELVSMDFSMLENRPRMLIKSRKNNRHRWLFWPEPVDEMLRRYVLMRKQYRWGNALFTSEHCVATGSGRFTTRHVQRLIRLLAEEAGIEKQITCHSFRHGRALRTKDVVIANKILGHKELGSTLTYFNMAPENIEAEARRTF